MTGRITMTVDGTPVSDADLARMHAEEKLHDEWQRRTVRVVAGAAADAADCRLLLMILGLDADVIERARTELPAEAKSLAKRRGGVRARSKRPATAKKSAEQAAPKAGKARKHAAA